MRPNMNRLIFNLLRVGDVIVHVEWTNRLWVVKKPERKYLLVRCIHDCDLCYAGKHERWNIYWGLDMKTKLRTALRLISRFTLGMIGAIAIGLCIAIWISWLFRQ
jgi:hypothetical protein